MGEGGEVLGEGTPILGGIQTIKREGNMCMCECAALVTV